MVIKTESKWWTSAQLGDRFYWRGVDWVLLTPWRSETQSALAYSVSGYQLKAVTATSLAEATPLHVENMRRHVVAVLQVGGQVHLPDGTGAWPNEHRGYDAGHDVGDSDSYGSLAQAAEALIPDDWQPPGVGS